MPPLSDPASIVRTPLEVRVHRLADDGTFPNNPALPVLVYPGALTLPQRDPAAAVERLFTANGWTPAWRFGVFGFHHYHATAHEALGVFRGRARLQLGGPEGLEVEAAAGDVLVLPAGVAHKCLASEDFIAVGAYPAGQDPDMNRGDPGERPTADERIAAVPLPPADPVAGTDGPLRGRWGAGQP